MTNPDLCFYMYVRARVFAEIAWWEDDLWVGTIIDHDSPDGCYRFLASQGLAIPSAALPRVIASPAVASGPGGRMLRVYVADATPGGAHPTPRVMARFWNTLTGTWGTAVALTDGAYSVNDPTAAFVGPTGNAVVAWTQNTLTPATDPNDIVATMAHHEIYYAAWDSTAWSAPIRLTNNALPDGFPVLAGDAGGVTLAWIRDGDGDFTTRTDWRVEMTQWDALQATWSASQSFDAGTAYAEARALETAPAEAIDKPATEPLSPQAPAAEITVCRTAGACDYTTVQAAVDAAATGDLVKVAAGTYTGVSDRGGTTQLVHLAKTVTIRGGYTTTNWLTSDPVANPTILNAQYGGRVLYITGSITPTIESLTITRGSQFRGGGIYINGASPTLRNNWIHLNTAYEAGGGVYMQYSGGNLTGNRITSNGDPSTGASVSGGGIYLFDSSAVLINNIVTDNHVTDRGSAIFVERQIVPSYPTLTHNTIVRNAVGDGGIYVDNSGGTVEMTNNIIAGNGIVVRNGSTAILHNELFGTDVYTIAEGTVIAERVIVADPALAADGYHLTAGSPAIDEGEDAGILTDIDGDVRPQGAAPDIGADETEPAAPGPCAAQVASAPAITYDTVQAAVDAASAGDTVKVAGTCTGALERAGTWQTVYVSKTLTLQGGYAPGDWSTPHPDLYPTTLDAEGTGRVAFVTGGGAVTLRNLSLTNGVDAAAGGGVYNEDVALTLNNTTVVSNTAGNVGGGVFVAKGTVSLLGSEILSNTSGIDGGGLYVWMDSASATIDNASRIAYNVANGSEFWNGGGGIYTHQGRVLLAGGEISHNTAVRSGGGIFVNDPPAVYSQTGASLVAQNTAANGGGVFVDFAQADLLGGQIAENTGGGGGGVYVYEGHILLDGAEIVTNTATSGGGLLLFEAGGVATLASGRVAGNSASARGGGVVAYNATLILGDAVIADNVTPGEGGGIYLHTGRLEGDRGRLLRNSAALGGGLYTATAGAVVALDNVVIGNSTAGGGIHVAGGQVSLRHLTLARNGAIGLNAVGATSAVTMTNAIVVNHTVGVQASGGAPVAVDGVLWNANATNLSGASVTVAHATAGAPAFAADGYHLTASSAAIDQGVVTGVAEDIDGDYRHTGAAPDLGADEFVGTASGVMNAQVDIARLGALRVLVWTVDGDADPATSADRRIAVMTCGDEDCSIEVPAALPGGADSPSLALSDDGTMSLTFVVRDEAGLGNRSALWIADWGDHGGTIGWAAAPVRDGQGIPVYAEDPQVRRGAAGETLLLYRYFGPYGSAAYPGRTALSRVSAYTLASPPMVVSSIATAEWLPALAINQTTNQAVIFSDPLPLPGGVNAGEAAANAGVGSIATAQPTFVQSVLEADGELTSLTLDFGPDPALDPTLAVSQQHPLPGSSVTVTATVRSVGREQANDLTVRLYRGDPDTGVLLGTQIVSGPLAMNETQDVTFSVVAGSGTQTLSAEVTTSGEDLGDANNVAQGTLGTLPAPGLPLVAVHSLKERMLDIAWLAPDVPGVAGYRVLRGTVFGGPYELVGETEGTTFVDRMLTFDTPYFYRIEAFDEAGIRSSYSQEASGVLARTTVYLPLVVRTVGTDWRSRITR